MKKTSLPFLVFTVLLSTLVFFQVAAQQSYITELPSIEISKSDVSDLVWSPDGHMIAVASGNDIWIYNDTLEQVGHFVGHTQQILTLDWNSDGSRLASAGMDETIRIWDTTSAHFGEAIEVIPSTTNEVTIVKWNPSGDRLASVAADQTTPHSWADNYGNFAWISYRVDIWDASTWNVALTLEPEYIDEWALAWNISGSQIAAAGYVIDEESYAPKIWDAQTGELIETMGGFGEVGIGNLAFHPTQPDVLAIASDWGSVIIADVNSNNTLYQFEGFTGAVMRIDWKPDGNALLDGFDTGQILIWDYHTAQLLAVLQAHTGAIQGLKWNNLGTKFASSSVHDGKIKIWDAASLLDLSGLPTTTPMPIPTPFPTAASKP